MPEFPISPIDVRIAEQLGISPSVLNADSISEYQLEKIRALIPRLKKKSQYYAKRSKRSMRPISGPWRISGLFP